ncbi:methyltransferase-like protein 7A isoform X2 [Microcaecilia unicolor]|uniref:Methyltransferase-like protein 7A isoform X2 n=1 Tax=Microcaecilia unicolor TaxID=1415580 RepID=A0A6P7XNP9_9AMPH|nr:methyltransferase-like protein 7A isoform X2 [Microcaecilia unicolor]
MAVMALLIAILKVGVGLLALPVYVLHFLGLWDPICKRFFSFAMSIFTRLFNRKMQQYKKELFSTLGDFGGPSGQLTLLEIGCGSGANFQFFPNGCRVTCVDPNPHFQRYLSNSLKENKHIRFERFLVASAEEMTQVATASVDVVVSTLVFCSVKNIDTVLSEIKRVLRPGGGFFFLEHVIGHASSWTFFFQQILDPTWQRLFDGCHLMRETWRNLEQAGFTELKLRHITPPMKLNPANPTVLGYAVK